MSSPRVLPEDAPPQPLSPRSSNRALKGSSIRSLRKLLRGASQSSDAFDELIVRDEQLRQERIQAVESARPKGDTATKQHGDEVRLRLLRQLGIPPKPLATVQSDITNSEANPSSAQLAWGPSYTVPLNDTRRFQKLSNATKQEQVDAAEIHDKNKQDIEADSNKKLTENRVDRRIHFDPVAEVHPIPSFAVYSNRVKNTIWAGSDELAENVARNSLEFAYEHWDSNLVLDEESMMYHNGTFIHPVHLLMDDDEPSSEDDLWRQTCERMGIQPAEYYHSLQNLP